MRARHSLFGPLFLILLGVALLLNNLYPEISLVDFFAAYWPSILIAWGGFRLLENVAAVNSGTALPRPIGPGGVFLALLLIFVGTTLHATRDRGGLIETIASGFDPDFAVWAYDEFRAPVESVRTDSAVEVLVLDHIPGQVRVLATQGAEFEVEGIRTIRAVNQESADAEAAEEIFSAAEQNGRFTIFSAAGAGDVHRRIGYELTVKAPGGRLPRIESHRTRVEISGLSEAVEIDAEGGRLEIEEMNGAVTVRSDDVRTVTAKRLRGNFQLQGSGRSAEFSDIGGSVTIDGSFSRLVEGSKLAGKFTLISPTLRMDAVRIPGEVRIRSREIELKRATGPLEVHSEGVRNIDALDIEGAADIRCERGDITIRPFGTLGEVVARTGRGGIQMTLPVGAAFTSRVSTAHGKIRQEFGDALVRKKQDGGEQLSGSIGQGPLIELHSDRGDIRLKRRGAESLPAEAPVPIERPTVL